MGDQAGVGNVPAELATLDPATCLVLECVGGGLGQPALGDQPGWPSVDDREGHDPIGTQGTVRCAHHDLWPMEATGSSKGA